MKPSVFMKQCGINFTLATITRFAVRSEAWRCEKRAVVRSVPLLAAWQPASVVLLRLFCVSPDAIFICDRNDFGFMNCSFIF